MKKMIALLAVGLLAAVSAGTAVAGKDPGTGVYQSVHDLTNGPGGLGLPTSITGFVVDGQKRLCAYCHTPHHAIVPGDAKAGSADFLPLWSHDVSTQTYTPYVSATFDPLGGKSMNGVDPLMGPSRLCMSCHDGMTAVDNYYNLTNGTLMTNNPNAPFTGQPMISLQGETNHPLGFSMADVIPGYTGATNPDNNSILALTDTSTYQTGLANPTLTVTSRLYGGAIMTCSSCHDVHNTLNKVSFDTNAANFLLLGSQKNSGICLSCHTQGGGDTGQAHTTVPATAFTYP